ncbi:DUF6507 family protein [Streptomyces sp. NPDC012389]|uniref:DUF6507 family protein n=1 Tax=Streptomyces sp. NPDC012389 TaxID=3364830 RepID=UPI0036E4742D
MAPGQAPLPQAAIGPVAAALGQYALARQAQLKSTPERIQAAVLGAAAAANEYVEGDLTGARPVRPVLAD